MPHTDPAWAPGQMVAHYSVQKRLAAGGLGTVYLAEDSKLHRKVALKVLHSAAGVKLHDGDALLREARAAAALNHPNIVSIYEVLEADGRLVMVMEWVDGGPLGAQAGGYSADRLVSTASGLASALKAAHDAGVVHGDLKPGNVLVDRDGRVRLLDFGIARRLDDQEPSAELYAGTIPYMSPELIRGAAPSPQSDLWALGVLLYELATGERPFTGDYEAAIQYAILHSHPPSVRAKRPDLPQEFSVAIDTLLARDPNLRFASAHHLLEALRVSAEHPGPTVRRARWSGRTRALAAAAVTVMMVIGYALVTRPKSATARVVAVLPFENLGDSAQDYFALGMTDAVISLLARDTQLFVISRLGVMQYQHDSLPTETIAQQLAADYIITGTIQQESGNHSDRLHINTALTRATGGRAIWAQVYDQPASELFAMQERIAADVRTALGLGPGPNEPSPTYTENPQAYDLYLRGNDYFNRTWTAKDIRFAIKMYEGAVEADPAFARAYAMLARAYASMFWEYFDRSGERCIQARAAADRALELDPKLADAHVALGYYYYHCELDYPRAWEAFRHALELEPKNAEVLNAIGAVERRQSNYAMAVEHFKASLALDPRSYMKAFEVGLTYGVMRKFDEAMPYLDRAITLGPDFYLAHIYKAWLAILRNGDKQAAAGILSAAAAGSGLEGSAFYWWLQRIVAPDLAELVERVPALEDTAAYYLFKAQVYRLIHKQAAMSACADSARVWLEPHLVKQPNAARYLSYLGLAHAYLGNRDQALHYGKQAVDLLPTSRDAFDALFLSINMAEISMVVGESDQAIAQLRGMLDMPGFVSIPYFLADPLWAPLRTHPEFVKLLAESS